VTRHGSITEILKEYRSPPQSSVGMIMATVFWALDGISLENFMQHKTIITDAAVLLDLKVLVSEGRIGKVTCMPCILTAMLLYTNYEKQSLLERSVGLRN